MATAANTKLYLYNSPFVVLNRLSDDFILEYMDEAYRADEEKIRGLLLKFAMDNGLVDVKESGLYPSDENNSGSLQWIANWMNFRSLVDENNLDTLLQALNQNDSLYINQLIDLHARLGMLFDHVLLNTITNRVYQTLDLIRYKVADGHRALSWEEVHKLAPFLWVLFLMQTVIRTNTKPLPV